MWARKISQRKWTRKKCEWNGKKVRKLTAKNHDNGVEFSVPIG